MDVSLENVALFLAVVLVHVGWMGLFVGAVAWVIEQAEKNSTPAVRYNRVLVYFTILFLCIPAAVVLTGSTMPSGDALTQVVNERSDESVGASVFVDDPVVQKKNGASLSESSRSERLSRQSAKQRLDTAVA